VRKVLTGKHKDLFNYAMDLLRLPFTLFKRCYKSCTGKDLDKEEADTHKGLSTASWSHFKSKKSFKSINPFEQSLWSTRSKHPAWRLGQKRSWNMVALQTHGPSSEGERRHDDIFSMHDPQQDETNSCEQQQQQQQQQQQRQQQQQTEEKVIVLQEIDRLQQQIAHLKQHRDGKATTTQGQGFTPIGVLPLSATAAASTARYARSSKLDRQIVGIRNTPADTALTPTVCKKQRQDCLECRQQQLWSSLVIQHLYLSRIHQRCLPVLVPRVSRFGSRCNVTVMVTSVKQRY
jgi:hypothetical protein